ncbi:MAG: hypothetical protein ACYTGQ_09940 [Planctomycetota bacterium]|jgi:hypothetical protein
MLNAPIIVGIKDKIRRHPRLRPWIIRLQWMERPRRHRAIRRPMLWAIALSLAGVIPLLLSGLAPLDGFAAAFALASMPVLSLVGFGFILARQYGRRRLFKWKFRWLLTVSLVSLIGAMATFYGSELFLSIQPNPPDGYLWCYAALLLVFFGGLVVSVLMLMELALSGWMAYYRFQSSCRAEQAVT